MSDEDERYCDECGEVLEDDEEDFCTHCKSCMFGDEDDYFNDPDDERYLIDGVGFADPGGNSALRAATPDNPRDCDCPTCGAENVLTRIDKQRGYQCNACADRAEGGGW